MSDKGSFTFALQEIFDANPNRKKRPFGNCAKLQEKKQNVYQFWDPFQPTSKFHSNNSGKQKLKPI